MNFWRCKCGDREYFESGMPPRDCQGCEKCGTTLAMSKSGHEPMQPHVPVPRYSQTTGELRHFVCDVCGELIREGNEND